MPQPCRSLGLNDLREIASECFQSSGPDRYGIEAEWPTHRRDEVTQRPGEEEIARWSAWDDPGGGLVTFEPGGPMELSTAPCRAIGE